MEIDENIIKALETDQSGIQEWEIVQLWESGNVDLEMAEKFTHLMQSISRTPSIVLANKFNLKKLGIQSLLDVAAGSGCYSISFAKIQPGVKCIVLELPEVCKIAQNYIEKSNVENDSVLTYSCDMFKEPFPNHDDTKYGYQAIFFSQILHDWDDKTCQDLCNKAYYSLPNNGYIIIHEALLDDDGNGPLITALLSFDFFLTSKGKQFKYSEIEKFLLNAGFVDIKVEKTYGLFSIVYGKKLHDT
jgi:hypothetical protein